VIENPELENKGNLEYRAGDAIRELDFEDIVSLSVPSAEQKIIDGRVFYPAILKLEDSVSVPEHGFLCVEGNIKAKNAGSRFSIPVANVKELNRKED